MSLSHVKLVSFLTLGLLALTLSLSPAQAAPAAQATHKACHACGDETLSATPTPSPDGVVHAVMFWMDGCGHCEYVRAEVLPPLYAKYGPSFDLLLVEVATRSDVDALYAIGDRLGIGHVGVPLLLIGDHVLVGSKQIPEELPGLIETYLDAGGVPAPVIPELENFSSMTESQSTLVPSPQITPNPEQKASETALPDTPSEHQTPPARSNGFAIAIVVLVLMCLVLIFSPISFFIEIRWPSWPWLDWLFLALIVVGMGIAGYLTYVETQHVSAVCGPVGDCNAVQNSPYATLFGFLPVGLLGLLGYVALLAAWLVHRFIPRLRKLAALAMFGMAFFGVAFSIYLTYLEPFVIRAVCMWCISSAVIMTLLLILSLPQAARQFEIAEDDTI